MFTSHASAGSQDDRKRRTPCRKGRQGVEGAENGDYGVFREKSVDYTIANIASVMAIGLIQL